MRVLRTILLALATCAAAALAAGAETGATTKGARAAKGAKTDKSTKSAKSAKSAKTDKGAKTPAKASGKTSPAGAAVALRPGDQTDPSAGRPSSTARGYEPAEKFRVPYVSTYYVEPVVKSGKEVKLAFYMTDWDQSERRFADDSWRFDATVRLIQEQKKGKETSRDIVKKGLPAGDTEISLGTLGPGDYDVGVWCTDNLGRESHRVWHKFRVRTEKELEIPAAKIYTMKPEDLAKYKIRNDDHRERLAPSGGGEPPPPDPKQPGYVVSFPGNAQGIPNPCAFKSITVKYDPGYDKKAVEAEALQTTKGLNQMLAEKARAGFRKLVLLPGTYRLSPKSFVTMPDCFTLDMNGATFKENGFTGDHAVMIRFESTDDAHLVNGTIAGDYWEHDYEGSPHDSEWPMGFSIDNDSRYSSVENVKVVDVTGYGGGNGIGSDRMGGSCTFMKQISFAQPGAEPGELDRKTGKVNRREPGRVTSDFIDISAAAPGKYIQVSKYLGYQGVCFRGWWTTVCFYSSGKRLLSAETGFQYRPMRIPPTATLMRVSVDCATVGEAQKQQTIAGQEFMACAFRVPRNCSIVGCSFTHVRCVGYAAGPMRNFLFRNNSFIRSGEECAMSSFDAEDGWDMMQDTYMDGNKVWGNPVMTDIVICGGHNFIFEHNNSRIYMWERVYGAVARNNTGINGVFRCGSRRSSGYARPDDTNDWPYGLELGGMAVKGYADWDFGMRGLKFGPGMKRRAPIQVGTRGRLSGSTFQDMEVKFPWLSRCLMKGCRANQPAPGEWNDCEIHGTTFVGTGGETLYTRCRFVKCPFKHIFSGKTTFKQCEFKKCTFENCEKDKIIFEDCSFTETEQPKDE